MSDTLIIIPAFNEALSISKVVSEAASFGDVLVVDDGSTDATIENAEKFGATVVRHQVNSGYDAAITTGVGHALDCNYTYAITLDADGQLPTSSVPVFIQQLRNGADLVVGDRGGNFPRVAELVFSRLGKSLLGISDPFCGMKAYRVNYVRHVGVLSSYQSVGTGIAVRMKTRGAKIKNVPIEVVPRNGSSRMGSRICSEVLLGQAAIRGVYYFLKKQN